MSLEEHRLLRSPSTRPRAKSRRRAATWSRAIAAVDGDELARALEVLYLRRPTRLLLVEKVQQSGGAMSEEQISARSSISRAVFASVVFIPLFVLLLLQVTSEGMQVVRGSPR